MMTNETSRAVTVGELMAWLALFDPTLPVQMAMNQEYQGEVNPSDLHGLVVDDESGPYVLIGE